MSEADYFHQKLGNNQFQEVILCFEKIHLILPICLHQVSTSIGDAYFKKSEFSRDPLFIQYGYPIPLKRAVVSAEPSILIRKITLEDLFLIFSWDGLWEQLSDEEAVDIVLKNPTTGIAKPSVEAAAENKEMRYEDIKRLEKGERRHIHDDITVIVIYLGPERSTNSRLNIVKDPNVPLDIYSLNSGHQGENTSYVSEIKTSQQLIF